MALRRVFVDSVASGRAAVRGRTAHHLARVARLREGERVEISDQASAYRAVTERCSSKEVRFLVEEELPLPGPSAKVAAALSIVKFARFEWAVEKLTELGVESILPVVAARSDSKLVAAAPRRLARWRRIAFGAAQQSRRLAAPRVETPAPMEAALASRPQWTRLLADPGGRPAAQLCGAAPTFFLVGPEGGWSAEEVRMASEQGFQPACLGPTVLRTETAAVALAAICRSAPATSGG